MIPDRAEIKDARNFNWGDSRQGLRFNDRREIVVNEKAKHSSVFDLGASRAYSARRNVLLCRLIPSESMNVIAH
jgi:hypothetical protein